ncbi:OmpA family protein [Gallaecimonas kandeliae]|uniref:OmpA family protein n=1 Tax=Gallaecimonas kandeliae TaxID=3029055 RepID=UPI00264748F5|nr:OmpA family protein [Gallaecimonas kandeliae]WKE66518.1 OmpA family protein [Gallaecimonas kandeliae]
MHRTSLALGLGGVAFLSLAAKTPLPAMDHVAWQFKGDPFVCTLALPVAGFGKLRFEKWAGEDLAFEASPSLPLSADAEVSLSWRNAPWQEPVQSLRYPATRQGPQLRFSAPASQELLEAMDKGRWAVLTLPQGEMQVPSVHWQGAATAFRTCLDHQAPISYRQARDQSLYYGLGVRSLTLAQRQQLAKLARYVQLDKAVRAVLVDAYTDDTGDHVANLQLARERAADVRAALVEAGLPKRLIQTRAHADRYPATDNKSARARALNRRVTLRVLKDKKGKSS